MFSELWSEDAVLKELKNSRYVTCDRLGERLQMGEHPFAGAIGSAVLVALHFLPQVVHEGSAHLWDPALSLMHADALEEEIQEALKVPPLLLLRARTCAHLQREAELRTSAHAIGALG